MANEVTIWNPPGGGDDWPLVTDDNGVQGIEADGGRTAESVPMCRVYAQVFKDSVPISSETVPKLPWPWQGADSTLCQNNNGNEWHYELSNNNIIPVPDPTAGNLYTLIVWGEFEQKRCYSIAKSEFTLTNGSGGSSFTAGGGKGPYQRQAFRVAPRGYRLWIDPESIDLSDAGYGGAGYGGNVELPFARSPMVLEYDESNGTRDDMIWQTGRNASNGSRWTLHVKGNGEKLAGELLLPEHNGGRPVLPLRWRAPNWDSFARNRLFCREASRAGLPTAFVVEPL